MKHADQQVLIYVDLDYLYSKRATLVESKPYDVLMVHNILWKNHDSQAL